MTGRAVGGAPGRAKRFPAPGSTRARGPGGGATVLVNGGARRAHHPSDRSLDGGRGGGGVAIKVQISHAQVLPQRHKSVHTSCNVRLK